MCGIPRPHTTKTSGILWPHTDTMMPRGVAAVVAQHRAQQPRAPPARSLHHTQGTQRAQTHMERAVVTWCTLRQAHTEALRPQAHPACNGHMVHFKAGTH
eukprot:1152257-Pelagomonas_calceolata.AAC.3